MEIRPLLRQRKSTKAGDITRRVNWGDAIPSDMSFPQYLQLPFRGKFKLKFVKKFCFEELSKFAVSKSLSLHTQYQRNDLHRLWALIDLVGHVGIFRAISLLPLQDRILLSAS